jgi:epoxide hydrolase-like predicted phosphatase
MIRAVLFDYSGVFTTPPFQLLGELEVARGYPEGSMLRILWGDYGAVGGDHPWHRLERGEISLGEYWADFEERAAAEVGDAFDADAYREAMRGGFSVYHVMVHKVRELRDRYTTALLTNNVREFGEAWRLTIPVEELFDHVVDSCEVGARKPEPAFYRRALEVVGVPPEEAVFLDDMASNIEGARAVGITAIHVVDVPEALAALDALLEGSASRRPGT